jgi:predicted flavoprotein YhiN
MLEAFSPVAWRSFIENLGVPTFEGSTGRLFIEDKKASRLLLAWREDLQARGVEFCTKTEWRGFSDDPKDCDAVVYAMGGGSWEPDPVVWPQAFRAAGFEVEPFGSSNVGYRVKWPEAFLKEAERKPLKNIEQTMRLAENNHEMFR